MEDDDAPVIIVLDDSFEDRFFLRRTIRKVRPEATVLEFTYAMEALEFLLTRQAQGLAGRLALFVDINIPRMDGFEFLSAFSRQVRGAGDALVVVMSNSIDPGDRERANALPVVHGFETKPVGQKTLRALFERLEGGRGGGGMGGPGAGPGPDAPSPAA